MIFGLYALIFAISLLPAISYLACKRHQKNMFLTLPAKARLGFYGPLLMTTMVWLYRWIIEEDNVLVNDPVFRWLFLLSAVPAISQFYFSRKAEKEFPSIRQG